MQLYLSIVNGCIIGNLLSFADAAGKTVDDATKKANDLLPK